MDWNDPLRLAIHELGHVVVEYVLSGTCRCCYIFKHEDGSYGANTEAIEKAQSAITPQDHIRLAAEFLGGWAAVCLAIEGGILPRAPDTIEKAPGEAGYIGSDQIYTHWAAVQANPRDPEAALTRARILALEALTPWMAQIVELAKFGAASGYVTSEMVEKEITR